MFARGNFGLAKPVFAFACANKDGFLFISCRHLRGEGLRLSLSRPNKHKHLEKQTFFRETAVRERETKRILKRHVCTGGRGKNTFT